MKKNLMTAFLLSVFSCALILTAPVFSQESDDDDHFISPDKYFTANEKLKGAWMYVNLATMKTPASAKTKNEAEFILIRDGAEIWTKFFWKTRILSEKEIKIGLEVIALEVSDGEVYRAPENKDEAIHNNWFMAKITDVSDLYKGYVTVSGGYKVKVNNMRVITK
jgi:hypothetical protein